MMMSLWLNIATSGWLVSRTLPPECAVLGRTPALMLALPIREQIICPMKLPRLVKILLKAAVAVFLIAVPAAEGQTTSSSPFEQKTNVVYGETHGTGLLMDIFAPKANGNGLAIVDVVSGAYNSDRGKIREHAMAQIYTILCSRGYVVFALRPGSKSRYTGLDMLAHVKTGIRYIKEHASEYKIDPERLGLTGASAGGHLATLAAVTAEEAKRD